MIEHNKDHPVYVVIWEYQPKPDRQSEFEAAYGRDGDWVRFFRSGEGYLGTELYRDVEREGRYMTVDYWVSESAYTTFREQSFSEYEQIDKQFEALTNHEAFIGAFVTVGQPPHAA